MMEMKISYPRNDCYYGHNYLKTSFSGHTAEWITDQTFKMGHRLKSIRENTFNMKRENNTTFNM